MSDLGAMYDAGGAPSREGTLLGLPAAGVGGVRARAAILGADAATPYASVGAYCAGGPAAIRAASRGWAGARGHVNFDLGRAPPLDAVDRGDLPIDPATPERNRAVIREAVSEVARGAVPVLLGGDDSVQIPMLEAVPGPLHILQLDAHIDWREEVGGERLGLSSTMRRASEMEHVRGMVQVGQRGLGSAREEDLRDALDWGAVMVPARDVRRNGALRAAAAIPHGARVALCLDLDAMDPSVVPSVIARTPGGLSHWDVVELVEAVAARAEIAAVGMVEMMPSRDVDGIGAAGAAGLLAAILGIVASG